jgi:phosphatidylserine decarboxylase
LPTYPYHEDKNYIESLSAEKAGPFYQYLKDETCDSTGSKSFKKGEMTGRFEMGSTIVLIFEGDSNTELNVIEGQKLSLGDLIVKHQD